MNDILFTEMTKYKNYRILSFITLNIVVNVFIVIFLLIFCFFSLGEEKGVYDEFCTTMGMIFLCLLKISFLNLIAQKTKIIEDYKKKDVLVILLFLFGDLVLIYLYKYLNFIAICCIVTIPMLLVLGIDYINSKLNNSNLRNTVYIFIYFLLSFIFFIIIPDWFIPFSIIIDSASTILPLFFAIAILYIIKNLYILGVLYLFKFFPFRSEKQKRQYIINEIVLYIAGCISIIYTILRSGNNILNSKNDYCTIILENYYLISLNIIIFSLISYLIISLITRKYTS